MLCAAQLLTKAGLLNVPEWYEAGKGSIETCGIPFGEWSTAVTARNACKACLPGLSAARKLGAGALIAV